MSTAMTVIKLFTSIIRWYTGNGSWRLSVRQQGREFNNSERPTGDIGASIGFG